MLVVAALGGSVLLRRGERMTAQHQRDSVRAAAEPLAAVAADHQLVVSHGSGPQAGLLALQGAAYAKLETYPPDVLAAQAEGMIGYLIEQELASLLPPDRPCATMLTMVEVEAGDPAFDTPTTFIGPVYLREEAERLSADKGWVFKPDGDKWRRVVASPEPKRIFELRPMKWLLEHDTVVIAAGAGGIPTIQSKGSDRRLEGSECVVDKDLASGLLARELGADLFLLLTDADAVYAGWGTPAQRAIRRASPAALAELRFPPGSMGSKVRAACRFATDAGRPAAIGALADIPKILDGQAGTTITASERGIRYVDQVGPANVAAQS
jgi:carbamate kinase